MSHSQIIMFLIGGALVLGGLCVLIPILLRRGDDPAGQGEVPREEFMPPGVAAALTPAAAPAPGMAPPQQPPAPRGRDVDFDAGLAEELFAELFSLRLAVDGVAAEVRSIRKRLDEVAPQQPDAVDRVA